MEINRDLIRYGLLIAATPVWLPFLRALWKDFNKALREEGGLLGSAPTGRELDEIRRERAREPDHLRSEPIVPGEDRRAPRLRSGSPTSARATSASTPPAPARRGFRSSESGRGG